jgi:hypothetical protein
LFLTLPSQVCLGQENESTLAIRRALSELPRPATDDDANYIAANANAIEGGSAPAVLGITDETETETVGVITDDADATAVDAI